MQPDMRSLLQSFLIAGMVAGIVYLVSGEIYLGAVAGAIAYTMSRMDEGRRGQDRRIAALERRMLEVEEGKASSSWVARIDESREQDRRYLDGQIDAIRSRRSEGAYQPSRGFEPGQY